MARRPPPSDSDGSSSSGDVFRKMFGGGGSGGKDAGGPVNMRRRGSTSQELGLSALDLTAEDIAQYREIFQLVDLDHGGSIDEEELASLMDLLGLNPSEAMLKEMINTIDTTGTGEIDFADFVRVVSRRVDRKRFKVDELLEAFKKFEGSAPPGHIHSDDLKHLLSRNNNRGEEDLLKLVEQMEPDREGLINYRKYVETVLS